PGPPARPAPCAPRRPTDRPRRRPPAAAGWRIVCPPAPPSAPCWMQYWLRRRQRLEALTPPGAGGVHEGQQVSFADLRGYGRRRRPATATADRIESITANARRSPLRAQECGPVCNGGGGEKSRIEACSTRVGKLERTGGPGQGAARQDAVRRGRDQRSG